MLVAHDDENDPGEVSDGESGLGEESDVAIGQACVDLGIEVECVWTCPL